MARVAILARALRAPGANNVVASELAEPLLARTHTPETAHTPSRAGAVFDTVLFVFSALVAPFLGFAVAAALAEQLLWHAGLAVVAAGLFVASDTLRVAKAPMPAPTVPIAVEDSPPALIHEPALDSPLLQLEPAPATTTPIPAASDPVPAQAEAIAVSLVDESLAWNALPAAGALGAALVVVVDETGAEPDDNDDEEAVVVAAAGTDVLPPPALEVLCVAVAEQPDSDPMDRYADVDTADRGNTSGPRLLMTFGLDADKEGKNDEDDNDDERRSGRRSTMIVHAYAGAARTAEPKSLVAPSSVSSSSSSSSSPPSSSTPSPGSHPIVPTDTGCSSETDGGASGVLEEAASAMAAQESGFDDTFAMLGDPYDAPDGDEWTTDEHAYADDEEHGLTDLPRGPLEAAPTTSRTPHGRTRARRTPGPRTAPRPSASSAAVPATTTGSATGSSSHEAEFAATDDVAFTNTTTNLATATSTSPAAPILLFVHSPTHPHIAQPGGSAEGTGSSVRRPTTAAAPVRPRVVRSLNQEDAATALPRRTSHESRASAAPMRSSSPPALLLSTLEPHTSFQAPEASSMRAALVASATASLESDGRANQASSSSSSSSASSSSARVDHSVARSVSSPGRVRSGPASHVSLSHAPLPPPPPRAGSPSLSASASFAVWSLWESFSSLSHYFPGRPTNDAHDGGGVRSEGTKAAALTHADEGALNVARASHRDEDRILSDSLRLSTSPSLSSSALSSSALHAPAAVAAPRRASTTADRNPGRPPISTAVAPPTTVVSSAPVSASASASASASTAKPPSASSSSSSFSEHGGAGTADLSFSAFMDREVTRPRGRGRPGAVPAGSTRLDAASGPAFLVGNPYSPLEGHRDGSRGGRASATTAFVDAAVRPRPAGARMGGWGRWTDEEDENADPHLPGALKGVGPRVARALSAYPR